MRGKIKIGPLYLIPVFVLSQSFCYCCSFVFHFLADRTRDVKSSRPKWPRGQNFGLGLGLKHLASAWPRSAAEEPAAKKRSTDQSVCQLQDITV